MSVLYFVIFRTLILKLNLKTPGREDDDEETRLYSKEDYKKKAESVTASEQITQNINELGEEIIEGLGGRDNIEVVDNCYTRLRVIVKNVDVIHEDLLKKPVLKALFATVIMFKWFMDYM